MHENDWLHTPVSLTPGQEISVTRLSGLTDLWWREKSSEISEGEHNGGRPVCSHSL